MKNRKLLFVSVAMMLLSVSSLSLLHTSDSSPTNSAPPKDRRAKSANASSVRNDNYSTASKSFSEAISEMTKSRPCFEERASNWLKSHEVPNLSFRQPMDDQGSKLNVDYQGRIYEAAEGPPACRHVVEVAGSIFLFADRLSRRSAGGTIMRLNEKSGEIDYLLSVSQTNKTLAWGFVVNPSSSSVLRVGVILPDWGESFVK